MWPYTNDEMDFLSAPARPDVPSTGGEGGETLHRLLDPAAAEAPGPRACFPSRTFPRLARFHRP